MKKKPKPRHLHRGYALASVNRGASVAETGVPQPSTVG